MISEAPGRHVPAPFLSRFGAGSDDPDCCIADLNMDGVIGLMDRLLLGRSMVEFVPFKGVR